MATKRTKTFRVLWTFSGPFEVTCEDTDDALVEACRKRLCLFSDEFWRKATLHAFGTRRGYRVVDLRKRHTIKAVAREVGLD
jgi:hypothetical protein